MADESTDPTAPVMAPLNDDANTPVDAVTSAAQVVPPAASPVPAAPAASSQEVMSVGQAPIAAPVPAPTAPPQLKNPVQAVAAATQVVPPIVKTSTTTVQGRSKAGVAAQIKTDQAALDALGTQQTEAAKHADARAQAVVDAQLKAKDALQTQLREDKAQYETDRRSADAEAQRYMDLPDGKIDPDRFMSSLSTGSKIAMTVLAALSGFGQSLAGDRGPNAVIDQVQKRINADIEAQKDELAQGRIRKNNLIARALAKGADAKQAEQTATAQLWQLAGQIGDLQAQRLGLQGVQLDAAKNAIAGMQYQASLAYGNLRAQTESKIQTTREQETGKPANTAAALAELLHKAGELKMQGWSDAQLQAIGLPIPAGPSESEKKANTEASKRNEDQGKAQGALNGLDQYGKAAQMTRDEAGKWVPPKGKADDTLPTSNAWSWDPRFWRWGANGEKTSRARERASAALGELGVKNPDSLLTADTYQELADALNAEEDQAHQRLTQQDRSAPAAAAQFGGKPVQ